MRVCVYMYVSNEEMMAVQLVGVSESVDNQLYEVTSFTACVIKAFTS